MTVVLDRAGWFTPGDETLVGSEAECAGAAVVFEDDGRTGYFYACEAVPGPVLDALHIYGVDAVADRDRPSEYGIAWSPRGRQAVLLINGYAHAVFDFDRKKGWCRDGLGTSNGTWSIDGHAWDDDCLRYFREPSS